MGPWRFAIWRTPCVALCAAAAATLLPMSARRACAEDGDEQPASAASQPARNAAQSASPFANKASGDWCGARSRLKEAGLTFDFDVVLEGFKNFRGGLDTARCVGAPTLDLNVTIDAEKLLKWRGATFYTDLEYHGGENPSEVLVGDLQVFDKLNTATYFQFFELWYEQKLLDDKLRIKVGKVDANTEFSVIDNGLPFLNSSAQVSPTVFVFPTTPDPMPSVNVFFKPTEWYYASFGAYYSNRSVRFGNLVGNPQSVQLSDSGAFLIGETGLKWHHDPLWERSGNLRFGGWAHTGTFPRLPGNGKTGGRGASAATSQPATGSQHGAGGFYAIFDQTLWQPPGAEEDGPGLRSFLEYGVTQGSVSTIDQHAGAGATWTGVFPGRPKDILGFAAQYAHISPEAGLPRDYELAWEAFYRVQVTKWATLQPDLQYIVNPGGQYRDAVVLTLHLKISL